MKEEILDKILNDDKTYKVNDFYEIYKDKQKVEKVLKDLQSDALIYITSSNKCVDFSKTGLKKGVFDANKKGFAFVRISKDEEDLYISRDNVGNAIENDIVAVEIVDKDKNAGRVVKVLKRPKDYLVGEVYFEKDTAFIKPDNKDYNFKLFLSKEDSKDLVDGNKVLVNILEKIEDDLFKASVEKVIGHINDPRIDVLSIAYEHGFTLDLDEKVYEELEKIPNVVREKDLINRRDLSNKNIFTIDGNDTKDIDDAISLEVLENGNYLLGVHIADVTYYFKKNSALDISAYERATSVYLTDYVLPMIPHKLSNGICSLNEGDLRLTITCDMEFDDTGNIVDHDIYPSYIKSKKKMTYDAVNRILEENIVDPGYEEYQDVLIKMNELAKKIRKRKVDKGYINFDSKEAKILLDGFGIPYDIVVKRQGSGEKLIEEFMVSANETVATHIKNMDLPFIYRIHESPKPERIKEFLLFLSSLSYTVKGDLSHPKPKDIQNVLNQLKDKKEYPVLSDLMLRTMQKAIYSNVNVGHFGLASKCYTHFTAPIRRYPDEIVHRLLRKYLFDSDYSNTNFDNLEQSIGIMAEHSSLQEREAVDCEREVDSMKMAEYMENFVGEHYEGMITSVKNFGFFVRLDNLVEGLVSKDSLDGFYNYDEERQVLVGPNKKTYKIGQTVKVKVEAASKEARTIDFVIDKGDFNERSRDKK